MLRYTVLVVCNKAGFDINTGVFMASFSKKEVFPKISSIIDNALFTNQTISRDEIVELVVLIHKDMVEKASAGYKNSDLFNVAGNMVDWFSADITKKSNVAIPWIGKYVRTNRLINKRKITVYSLSIDIAQDEEIKNADELYFREGAVKQVLINAYERNAKAREMCIKIHGLTCVCCGFDFKKAYGDIGYGFIHIHHIKPISEIGCGYIVNPEKDLCPVCPNCHAMIHRKSPPFTVEEIKDIVSLSQTLLTQVDAKC